MSKNFASLMVIFALFCTLGVHTAFAARLSEPEIRDRAAEATSETAGPNKSETAPAEKPNEKLRQDMLKLVADAKAGKAAPVAKSQIQPAKGNNWSKGTKIAVGVGIAVAVIAVIVIVKAKDSPGRVF